MEKVGDSRAEFVHLQVNGQSDEPSAPAHSNSRVKGRDLPFNSMTSDQEFADVDKTAGAAIPVLPIKWRTPDPLHEDKFATFIRLLYFPFLVKYCKHVLVSWIVVFIICIVFGPKFLSSTRSNLDLPKGTPSEAAVNAFQDNYPHSSSWPPAFIVYRSTTPGQSVANTFSKEVSLKLDAFAKKYPKVIGGVSGYWELIENPQTTLLAERTISPDKQIMISTVYFLANATLPDITSTSHSILEFASHTTSPDLEVRCTGTFPLFKEMSEATEQNFAMIDGIVLPIAICILGITLRSYRHMFVAFCNLGCTLLLAFALLVPVSDVMDMNPFAPSVMLSLGIAVCFDYSLFMLTRFREERMVLCKSKEDAVFACVAAAGHVVCLSGATLFATFLLLVAFPQNFLQSVGTGCATVVLTAMISNMSLTPAMLLAFDCLSHFDAFPSRASCCWRVPPEDPAAVAIAASKVAATAAGDGAGHGLTERTPRTLWFKFSDYMTRYAVVVLLAAAVVTVPFTMSFFNMTPTSDDYLVFLQGSQSVDALKLMTKAFPPGSLNPYSVIVTTGKPDAVFTADYFKVENTLVHQLIRTQGQYMEASGVKALSFYDGVDVPLATAAKYFDKGSDLYGTAVAGAYRVDVGPMLNQDKSASMVRIETSVPPTSEIIVGFIKDVRAILTSYGAAATSPAGAAVAAALPVKMHLFGGYTTTLDVQEALYAMVPIEIGVTVAIVVILVGMSFGSLGLALRLILTILISLSWTYGLTVLVYQPGPSQDSFKVITPTLSVSTGIYWIVPVMSFSILVGLALDYDIFLMTRVVEFRRRGWSDRASVCLAIERTAGIITAAGLIMCISFAGLLIPKTVVLNQYGFTLFIGVAIDTFVIRPMLVPAIVTLLGVPGINWWPMKLPPVTLNPEQERRALAAGLWDPLLVDDDGNIIVPAALDGVSVVDGGDAAAAGVPKPAGLVEERVSGSDSGDSSPAGSVELAAVYRPTPFPADGAQGGAAAPAEAGAGRDAPMFDHGVPIRQYQ